MTPTPTHDTPPNDGPNKAPGPLADHAPLFETDHLDEDFRGRTVRGGFATLGAEGVKLLISIGTLAVLARLLTVHEYGLVQQVMAVTVLLSNFKDLGLAISTIQSRQITQQQISTLFWINAALGVALGVLTAAIAPLVAWFYGEPETALITLGLALTFLFGGLTVQHQALLRRQMRFGQLANIEIAAAVASSIAAIAVAALGGSYWSLVVMHVLRAVVIMSGVWWACRWTPERPSRAAGLRSMLSVGANLAAFNVLTMKIRSLDKILIGRFSGSEPLGLYSAAYNILLIPLQRVNFPLTLVAIPSLSRLQDRPDAFRAYYRMGLLLLTSITMPIVAACFVASREIILIVLGDRWSEAIPIFRALIPAAFLISFESATRWVFVSSGRTGRLLLFGLISAPATLAGIIIGLFWGPVGVALGIAGALALVRIPEIIYCFRDTDVRWTDLVAGVWRPAVASTLGALAGVSLALALPESAPPAAQLSAKLAAFAAAYAGAWLLLPNGIRLAFQMRTLLDDLRGVNTPRASV